MHKSNVQHLVLPFPPLQQQRQYTPRKEKKNYLYLYIRIVRTKLCRRS